MTDETDVTAPTWSNERNRPVLPFFAMRRQPARDNAAVVQAKECP